MSNQFTALLSECVLKNACVVGFAFGCTKLLRSLSADERPAYADGCASQLAQSATRLGPGIRNEIRYALDR